MANIAITGIWAKKYVATYITGCHIPIDVLPNVLCAVAITERPADHATHYGPLHHVDHDVNQRRAQSPGIHRGIRIKVRAGSNQAYDPGTRDRA